MTTRERYVWFLAHATKDEILNKLVWLEELAYAEDGTTWRVKAFEMRKRWSVVSDTLKMFRKTYIT